MHIYFFQSVFLFLFFFLAYRFSSCFFFTNFIRNMLINYSHSFSNHGQPKSILPSIDLNCGITKCSSSVLYVVVKFEHHLWSVWEWITSVKWKTEYDNANADGKWKMIFITTDAIKLKFVHLPQCIVLIYLRITPKLNTNCTKTINKF